MTIPDSYRLLFDLHPSPMMVWDAKTFRYLAVNKAAVKHYGYSRREWLAMTLLDNRPAGDVRRLRNHLRTKRLFGLQGVWRHLKKDGTPLDAEITAYRFLFDGRDAVLQTVRDVTQARRSEEALRGSRELLDTMMANIPGSVCIIDREGRILFVNRVLEGYSKERVLTQTVYDFLPPESHAVQRANIERTFKTGGQAEFEVRGFGVRGRPAWYANRLGPVKDRGQIRTAVLISIDITEQKRLEEEIHLAGSREQSRLGRELHDSLGQHLVGIGLLAQSLKTKLNGRGGTESAMVGRLAAAADVAVRQVRNLSAGLLPAELLADGLPAALRELAAQAKRVMGLACEVRIGKRLPEIEDVALLNLYRIAQEALTNAAKHAGAKKVVVELLGSSGRLVMKVSDDGRGLRPRRADAGLGLKIMKHRARMIAGTFEIGRGPRGGTVVTCSCPSSAPTSSSRQPAARRA